MHDDNQSWIKIFNRPETMTFILLVIALIGASLLSEFFLDINYILRSFTLTAELSIAALVLTMVIISGDHAALEYITAQHYSCFKMIYFMILRT